MKYFPAFVDLTKHRVAIVGGGNVAQRKLEVLLKFTTDITLVSPEFSAGIQRLTAQHQLFLVKQVYSAQHVSHANLVIAATDDEAVNQQVYKDTQAHKQWVNVVDQPELCDYITPAIIDRSPVCVALSSGGTSPVLLRMLRTQVESLLPFNTGEIALFCDSKRDILKSRFDNIDDKRAFWESFFQQLTIQPANDHADLETLFNKQLDDQQQAESTCYYLDCGSISLDELNLRALKRLQAADLLITGEAVPAPFIEFVRRDAEKITVHDIANEAQLINESKVTIAYNVSEETLSSLAYQFKLVKLMAS